MKTNFCLLQTTGMAKARFSYVLFGLSACVIAPDVIHAQTSPYIRVNYTAPEGSKQSELPQNSLVPSDTGSETSETDLLDLAESNGNSEQPAATVSGATTAEQTLAPSESELPAAMTTPILPNVPSVVERNEQATESKANEGPAEIATESDAGVESSQAEANSTEADASQKGPALRKKFSILFTQQRPFLLYSQDASITYLMPNALVDHPSLGRYLRGVLEDRALIRWQEIRAQLFEEGAIDRQDDGRPAIVITGRVEDRFYSNEFSSLYLEEMEVREGKANPARLTSFNYNHSLDKPFGLSDLFQKDGNTGFNPSVELISAYVKADIVRQKTVRLGTEVSAEQDAWLKDLEPSTELLEHFNLVPSRETGKIAGLTFHFNPGILGAEADGTYTVYVPAAIFRPSLSETFAPHFGGEALMATRFNARGFSAASINIQNLKPDSEIGGDMILEGEVPGNWCDGFHLTLLDTGNGSIVTEGIVELLPDLPSYGLAGNMMRFRAEMSVPSGGGKSGSLVFEPFKLEVEDNHVVPRPGSHCSPDRTISLPDPNRDSIEISVAY